MKLKSILIFAGFALSMLPVIAGHSPLLPVPQKISYGNGALPVSGMVIRFISKPDAQDRFAAEQLSLRLYDKLHIRVPIRDVANSGPELLLNRTGQASDTPTDKETTGPKLRESYSIHITSTNAEISAGSSAGLFYGVQTMLQLVEGNGSNAVLPEVTVDDWPTLAYRGFMMDFSEGQLLRVSEIERQLDLLSRFKANQYFFYSEMSIDWPGYEAAHIDPNSRYSLDDIRRIIAYARLRHIDIVPCIELYGHMHQLFRVEKFADAGLPRYGDEFDPRNPRTLQIIDDLFNKTIELFPSPWCHVGFDEPWSLGKIGVTPGTDPFSIFVDYLHHLADRAQSRGKRLVYWADVENPASTLRTHPELIAKLPTNAISSPWQYDVFTNYDHFIKPLADGGLPTLIAPGIFNWNEIFPDYQHTFANINGMIESGRKFKTLGVLTTGWADCAQTLYRQSLPGLAAAAVAGWQDGKVNTNSFLADYSKVMYPPDEAPDVAAALEELSETEALFEEILHGATQHAFWHDPLRPAFLAEMEKDPEPCRKARLLAEEAEGHINHAMSVAPNDPTLKSLMMAARLFDYLGMKCLYANEWNRYFKELQANPDEKLVRLYIGVQMNQQGNGMMADLMDAVTGMREAYREAWLEESTPYRLPAALARWDAEIRFWQGTWSRVEDLLRTRKKTDPFPSIDAIRVKN